MVRSFHLHVNEFFELNLLADYLQFFQLLRTSDFHCLVLHGSFTGQLLTSITEAVSPRFCPSTSWDLVQRPGGGVL